MKLIDKLKTTTLDQDFLKDQFINAHPWRLPFAILNNASEETCKLADTFDMLDHNYRQYLCGNFKTLRKVFSHIRDVGNGWGLVLDYFDDRENNTQIIWMTERQFYHSLFSGDGNMIADIVILSGEFNEVALFYTFTYKVIKGYLGVAKRDIKIHKDNEKKRFHAYRSLYMGETLMKKELPKVEDIKALRCGELPTKEWISNKEKII